MFGYCIYECGVIYIALDGGECCGCVCGGWGQSSPYGEGGRFGLTLMRVVW